MTFIHKDHHKSQIFQIIFKVGAQKPEKCGSGVKEDNIPINWIQSTTGTLSVPVKPKKIIKKPGPSVIKDSGNYSIRKLVRGLLFRR